MTERRRGLGRGLGALIPMAPPGAEPRPIDVYFPAEEVDAPAPPTTPWEPSDDVRHDHATPPGAGERTHSENAHDEHADPEVGDHSSAVSGPAVALVPVPGARFTELAVDAIVANPRQPRTIFDDDELAELSFSVKEIGVLQPIVVRPQGDNYELVMGERRLRAAKAAGLERIPAIVRDTDDDALLRDALLENLHRSQLNPLEEAAAYRQLLDDFACTQEELAARIGRSRPQVSNTLRLLRLPPLVARRVAAGVLSAGHARALLGLTDGAAMERLAGRIVAEGLSVRTVEEIVALGEETSQRPGPPAPRGGRTAAPELLGLANGLSDFLDTRASISLGKHKGRVTIEFAGVDDLHRILDAIGYRAPE